MSNSKEADTGQGFQLNRRTLLKSAIGSVAIGSSMAVTAQNNNSQPTKPAAEPSVSKGYVFFTPAEQEFVEALVDHMIPADQYSPKGSDLGVNIFMDRALNDGWGKGDRLYLNGPWQAGTAFQGYQLPMMPAELARLGIEQMNLYCVKNHQNTFHLLPKNTKEELLKKLQSAQITFENGLSGKTFFDLLYQTVNEGFFCDPIYGGNVNKASWRMLGFPGVIATHAINIETYKNKPFVSNTLSISDIS